MDYETKLGYCSAAVTLNNRPAVICGARNEFATVACLPDMSRKPLQLPRKPDLREEFSWEAIARIVANGGHFTC